MYAAHTCTYASRDNYDCHSYDFWGIAIMRPVQWVTLHNIYTCLSSAGDMVHWLFTHLLYLKLFNAKLIPSPRPTSHCLQYRKVEVSLLHFIVWMMLEERLWLCMGALGLGTARRAKIPLNLLHTPSLQGASVMHTKHWTWCCLSTMWNVAFSF